MIPLNHKVNDYLFIFVFMDGKVGKVLRYIAFLLLAAVLLYFAFREVKWAEFWSALKACRWSCVALSMLFGVLAFFLRGLRWRQLLLPIDRTTSRLTCFNAVNISYIVNLALPRVGEFVRCGFITAHSQKDPDAPADQNRRLASYDKVLGTAALERSVDVLAMGLFLGLFLIFTWSRFGGFFSERIFGSAAEGFSMGKIAVLGALGVCAVAFILLAVRLADKVRIFGKVRDFCLGLWQGFASCVKMKDAWWFFLLTIMIWGCYWMMSASILWAVQGMATDSIDPGLAASVAGLRELGMTDALFLMLAGSLSSIVPVPGGFGAFHFIVAGAISSVYGVPFEFGMIFATLSHESQTVNQIICGGLSYLCESLRNK